MTLGPYVIFEGPDGTGKSTIAERLSKRTGWPVVHCGPPERNAWEEWTHQATSYGEGPVIFDRLHVGSMVYGRTFRESEDVTDFENWLVEGQLLSRGALLVHATLPLSVINKNLERGPDTPDAVIYEAPEKRARVRELYDDYFAGRLTVKPNFPTENTWRYDFTIHDMEEFADSVERWVSWELKSPRPDVIAAGNTRDPKVVLIGDRPQWVARAQRRAKALGRPQDRYLRLAASVVGPYAHATFAGQSGRYLHMCMRMAGLQLADTMVINATTWRDENQLNRVQRQLLEAEDVVCLGRNAERAFWNQAHHWADEFTPGARNIPHPQHWKRFAYKYQHVYSKLLRGDMTTEQAKAQVPWMSAGEPYERVAGL